MAAKDEDNFLLLCYLARAYVVIFSPDIIIFVLLVLLFEPTGDSLFIFPKSEKEHLVCEVEVNLERDLEGPTKVSKYKSLGSQYRS